MTIITLPVALSTPIPTGTCVVQVTPGQAEVRAFTDETDGVEDIIGVVYNSVNTSGRAGALDGPVYYDNSVFTFDESLAYNIPYQYNIAYDPSINASDTMVFAQVMYSGFCAVLKEQTLPTHWVKIREGVTYDWYVINL